MRKAIFVIIIFLFFAASKVRGNDSLIIAQSFINLTLTETYFTQLPTTRISNITAFIHNDLNKISDKKFISDNRILYLTCYSLLYLEKVKLKITQNPKANRKTLLLWKKILDSSVNYFNKITIPETRAD